MHACRHVVTSRSEPSAAPEPAPLARPCYARLRLEMLRLARHLVGEARADDLAQTAMRRIAAAGPGIPRDTRGLPRPAYLASLVHALAADLLGEPGAGAPRPATGPCTLNVGARGG